MRVGALREQRVLPRGPRELPLPLLARCVCARARERVRVRPRTPSGAGAQAEEDCPGTTWRCAHTLSGLSPVCACECNFSEPQFPDLLNTANHSTCSWAVLRRVKRCSAHQALVQGPARAER